MCWLQAAQSAEHSRLLPSHQLTRVTMEQLHTQHIILIVPCYGDTGAGAGSTLYCHYVRIVRHVLVSRVREHRLMMLSDYLTLVMIHHPPCLHGHGGGGVLMYYSAGALNTKYYCHSMHHMCVFCDQVFCFPTQRMTFVTIRFQLITNFGTSLSSSCSAFDQ